MTSQRRTSNTRGNSDSTALFVTPRAAWAAARGWCVARVSSGWAPDYGLDRIKTLGWIVRSSQRRSSQGPPDSALRRGLDWSRAPSTSRHPLGDALPTSEETQAPIDIRSW